MTDRRCDDGPDSSAAGAGSDCTPGRTVRFEDEICYSHGQFIRYPEGAQR